MKKRDTVHVALRASAARSLMERMAQNPGGVEDETIVNEMWRSDGRQSTA